MASDLVAFVAEYAASRAVFDPLVDRAVHRGRKVLGIAILKARGRAAVFNERTILKALQEAETVDDPVVAEYLGGLIASSDETDEAVAAVAQLARLSSLQLRVHYVIYRQLWMVEASRPTAVDLRSPTAMAEELSVYLHLHDLEAVLGLETGGEGVRKLLAALHVLAREDLIGPHDGPDRTYDRASRTGYDIQESWRLGELRAKTFPTAGLICNPTPTGVELFLRGCGLPHHDPTYIRSLPGGLVQAPIGGVRGQLIRDLPD